MKNGAIIVAMAILLSSCARYTLVKGGEEIKIGSEMASIPLKDWNKASGSGVDVWTLDGPILQQIIFVKGVQDGDYLIPIRGRPAFGVDDDAPLFEKGMNFIEVVELFESTLSQMKAQKLDIKDVRPYKTENTEGFRFEFDFITKEGLQKKGSAYGILKDERLFMVIYVGAKLYYFDKGKGDFEEVVRTLRILNLAMN
jgi:hypothetical protein